MLVFLEVNGFDFIEDQDRIAHAFENMAAGRIDQGTFFDWVREKSHTTSVGQ